MKRRQTRWIPQGYTERRDDQSDAVVYLSPDADGYLVLAYHGDKAMSPDFYQRLRNAEQRDRCIEQFFESRCQHAQFKTDQKDKAHARQQAELERCKVGAIYHTSWGYDQTNVEFFQVVAISGKMATLRELAQKREDTGFMCGNCVPVPNRFTGSPERHLIQGDGITIDNVRTAWFWDGKPHYFSEYA